MRSLFSAAAGDPAGPDPAVPIGGGVAVNHSAHQGAHWQLLVLLFAISLLLGAAVLLFAVAEQTKRQARRRARRYGYGSGTSDAAVAAAPLLHLGRRHAADVMKDDWRVVAAHTAAFYADVREKAPGWPGEAAKQVARFQAVLQPHLARLTRSGSAGRVTGEEFPAEVPASALAIPVRVDAHAHQGGRTRVSA